MARKPFKLKSGNATPFKQMGSTSLSLHEIASKIKDNVYAVNERLQDFGERHEEWKAKRKQASKGDDGLTKMERDRAEKKTRKPGESKYQFDVIGPYVNDYKPGEINKDFFVRTLYPYDFKDF